MFIIIVVVYNLFQLVYVVRNLDSHKIDLLLVNKKKTTKLSIIITYYFSMCEPLLDQ